MYKNVNIRLFYDTVYIQSILSRRGGGSKGEEEGGREALWKGTEARREGGREVGRQRGREGGRQRGR